MVAARAMAIPANRKISTPGGLTAFGTNSGRIGLVKACWGAANGVLRWIGKHARVQWEVTRNQRWGAVERWRWQNIVGRRHRLPHGRGSVTLGRITPRHSPKPIRRNPGASQ